MISDWSKRFNVQVVRCEDRPDRPQGDTVYRLIDLFTTHSGSWEPSDKLGAVTSWARDKYLRPLSAPDYFDDAGGDHHLFARVLDPPGKSIVREGIIRYWSDGVERLGDAAYSDFVRATPKQQSGWANHPVFNSFNPARGERGAWSWCPEGAADVVSGGGLPNNEHVSFFAVWQAQPHPGTRPDTGTRDDPQDRPTTQPPQVTEPPQVTQPPQVTEPPQIDVASIRRRMGGQMGIQFDAASAFATHARAHNLGAPLTDEVEVDGLRVQGFANGIVYAPTNQLAHTYHVRW